MFFSSNCIYMCLGVGWRENFSYSGVLAKPMTQIFVVTAYSNNGRSPAADSGQMLHFEQIFKTTFTECVNLVLCK